MNGSRIHNLKCLLCAGLLLTVICQPVFAGSREKPFFRAQLIFKPSLRFPRCHSSQIEALPDGSLVAAWWNGSEEGGRDNVIRCARRPSGKLSWDESIVAADTPDTTEGNPVLFSLSAQELWLFYRAGLPWVKMMWTKSGDGGKTWAEPEVFLGEPGWSFRSRAIRLANGDIIIPVMTHGGAEFTPVGSSTAFLYSFDRGKSWGRTEPVLTTPHNNEPSIIQRADGSLLCLMRPYDPEPKDRFLRRCMSFDNGRTWTEATRTDIPNPSKAIEMLKLRNGHVVLVFNDTQEDLSHLCLALSFNEGETWSCKRLLEDSPGRFTYPALTQTPDGRIHVSYTWRRTSIKHVEVNEEWIMDESRADTR